MAKTVRRTIYLLEAPFKELWARHRIKDCKACLRVYKRTLNVCALSAEAVQTTKEEIRVLKYEVQAWRSLLPRKKKE